MVTTTPQSNPLLPFLCYQGWYLRAFGGSPLKRPELVYYAVNTWVLGNTLLFNSLLFLFLSVSPSFTFSRPPPISAMSHSISQYNSCAVLQLFLNPCSRSLSPGQVDDTVGWGRRKTPQPCLIKMVKSWSWNRTGKLIPPLVPSWSPHLLA